MGTHIYKCDNGHYITDISDEPVEAHIGGTELVYCPACEEDRESEYVGQAEVPTSKLGLTVEKSEMNLILARDLSYVDTTSDEPYCLHCDGVCQNKNSKKN